jgi:MIP family channel proteins
MKLSLKATVAEAVATCLFVYIGTGTATTFSSLQTPAAGYTLVNATRSESVLGSTEMQVRTLLDNITINGSWGVITALAFGLAITVLVYATSHLSGGQLNPAVTLGLALSRELSPVQAAANIAAQIVGAILGSSFLYATIPNSGASSLGSNTLAAGVSTGNAIMGEIVMTFVLVSVVLETAANRKSTAKAQAPLAIGFAVFCAHAVLLPIDGCSINPARSLGPAIVSGTWPGTFWVFVVGPFVGALFAVPFHLFFDSDWDFPAQKTRGDPAVALSPTSSLPDNHSPKLNSEVGV